MKKGFTLIEVTVVIVILATLAVLVVPKVSTTIKNNKQKACDANVKTILDAAEMYVYQNTNTVNDAINTNGYYSVTLTALMQSEVLKNEIENPYGGNFNVNNTVKITKSGNVYSYSYEGSECK